MRFSKSMGCFYPDRIEYGSFPDDLIEVSPEAYVMASNRAVGESLDVVNGELIIVPRAAPTPEEVAATYTKAVQVRLDAAAIAAGYDDIKTAVTYAEEGAVPRFQAEGLAFRVWRSMCWGYCYAQLAAVQSGTRSQPTIPDFLDELPELVLP